MKILFAALSKLFYCVRNLFWRVKVRVSKAKVKNCIVTVLLL